MHTLQITATNKRGKEKVYDFTFAAKWEELTPLQLGRVGMALVADLHEDDKRMAIFKMLSEVPAALQDHISIEDLVFSVPKLDEGGTPKGTTAAVLPQLDWAFKPPVFKTSIVATLQVDRTLWGGPTNELKNFTLERWGMADHCLQVLQTRPSAEAFNNLLSALYCPAFELWTREAIEQRGERLASQPENIRTAAVMNYKGLRNCLPVLFPRTFKQKKKPGRDSGLRGMAVSLAGDVFGTPEMTLQANLHDVLEKCEQDCEEAARINSKIKHQDGEAVRLL